MSIRSVFRVQCDGPCGGWLSQAGDVIRLNPPSRDVGLFPGERTARIAALSSGWRYPSGRYGVELMCPTCTVNPLGIVLPPDHVCVCTHPLSQHNPRGLCTAIPTVLGCGCVGFLRDPGVER